MLLKNMEFQQEILIDGKNWELKEKGEWEEI